MPTARGFFRTCPANFGPVRARVTCIVNGQTISGESEPFIVPANGVVNIPADHLRADDADSDVADHQQRPRNPLTQVGATAAADRHRALSDGSVKDVTADRHDLHRSATRRLRRVGRRGIVQAVSSGTVIIQATHEGASGMTAVRVALGGTDTDGDGIPDDVEVATG